MNRLTNYFLVFILVLTGCLQNSFAQSHDSLASQFNRYRQNILTEKVFLHLHRTSFLTGETLWLKVYCVEAGSNKVLDFSKVAYVEIVDARNKSVLQAKVELQNGKGNASLFIPATLNSGNYTVVAYTSWMKNFPKEYFYNQPIVIINPFRKPEITQRQTSGPEIDAQFFPEGGVLLTGVESKVAFRVVDRSGRGINFSGVLKDELGNSVMSFQPSKFGLGNFLVTPAKESIYHAEITDSHGNVHSVKFPEVKDAGYAMRITQNENEFDIQVQARSVDQAQVSIFAHSNNQTIQRKSSRIQNGEARFTIEKNKLQPGVSHITLFNSNLEPVAERLVFIKPDDNASVNIKTDNKEYSPRRKVKVDLSLPSNGEQPFDLSVSVFRKDSLPDFEHQTITSYLQLTSDLHGQIENPNYYLTSGTGEDFENLMLTHGWRKFSWDKIRRSDFTFQSLPEIEGPIVEGVLYDETGKPAKNINTYLSTPSKKIQLYGSVSDESGNVRYTLKDINGSRKIYLQTNFSRDSLYEFKLKSPFAESSASSQLPPLELTRNLSNTLTSRSIAMQAQDIFWENDRAIVAETDSLPFYGSPDETYYLDDFTRFPVMEEVMREYVKGVWVRKRKNEFIFIVLDNVNKSVFNENSLILLDGVPIFRVNDIMNVNPLKIKKIDVVTRQFYIGKLNFPGIVSFTTYTNDLAGIQLDRKNITIDYEGLQRSRTFFTPVYDSERQRSNRLPDQRSLLFWNPSLTMTGGQLSFDCYTSDIPGSYEITIQGLSEDGVPVSGRHSFTVSNFNN